MPEPGWSRSSRWITVLSIEPEVFGADREAIRLALEEENIESRPVWKPMHMQPLFRVGQENPGAGRREPTTGHRVSLKPGARRYPARVVGGSVAEDLFEKGLCLPSGTALSNSDLDRVIEVIQR